MNSDDRECLTAHIEHLKHISKRLEGKINYFMMKKSFGDGHITQSMINGIKNIDKELGDRISFIEGYLNRHQPAVLETQPQIIGFITTEKSWWKCTGCNTILHTQKEVDDHKCTPKGIKVGN